MVLKTPRRAAVAAVGLGAVLVAALVPAAHAADLELIPDGGFESGSLEGWSAQRGGALQITDDARTGDQAMQVNNRTGTQSGPYFDMSDAAEAGVEYSVSLWLKWNSAEATVTEKTFNLTTWSGAYAFDDRFSVTAQEGEWTELTGTFTLTEDQVNEDTSIMIETPFVGSPGANDLMSFVVDDVSLLAPIPEDANIIENGGFEEGIEPWYGDGNGVSTIELTDETEARTGDAALLVSERAGTFAGASYDLSGMLEQGRQYYLSAWVRYEGEDTPATKRFNGTARFGGTSNTYFDFAYTNSTGNGVAAKGEWTEITGTLNVGASANVDDVILFFETPYVASGDPDADLMDFYLDDVVMTLLPEVETPEADDVTIPIVGKRVGEHNPLMSHRFGADGNAFVFDGRVYIYMTNDTQEWDPTLDSDTNTYARINEIVVISSDDMVNWVDHGAISVAGPEGAATWASNSWAPAFAAKEVDGEQKFFLYFSNNGSSVGVLEGPTPTGPFTSPLDGPLADRNTPGVPEEYSAWYFDPGVYVADDGQAYLYYGGGDPNPSSAVEDPVNNPMTTYAVKLADDMISLDGEAQVVDAPNIFEASHVFERDGKYYYSYSTDFTTGGRDPGAPPTGAIAYLMADDPMGPWTPAQFAGTAFLNQANFFGSGTGGNNHQSFFELNGEYYFTYHAPTINARMNSEAGTNISGYRSPHMQKVEFNEDGTIVPIVGNYAGVEQIKNFDPFRVIEAETIGWQSGVLTELIERGSAEFGPQEANSVLTALNDGDWTALSSVDFGDEDEVTLTARAKPLAEGAAIEVRAGSSTGSLLGTIDLDGTVDEFGEFSTTLSGVAGVHDIFFVFTGAEDVELADIDTWTMAPAGGNAIEFGDVTPESTEFYEEIMWLAGEGISLGWETPEGREFRPTRSITRDAMAAFLYRYEGEPEVDTSGPSPFVDVTPDSTEFYEEIVWLSEQDITLGWDTPRGQEFRPTAPITRDAMAAFLYRLAGEPDWDAPEESPFVDITDSNTEFYTEITWLADTGITQGWDSPRGLEFRPFSTTTRDAMAAFLFRYDDLPV
ncbi:carbohydrate binding domain-containing protein [Demequina sp. NBRC 110053]|uniref:carbohydrate binding domain-containing protein n=1 Tax=Demequina sp. NBRC 110053 TaxID=1570342 RepID=UPI00135669E2|nr:carbohydrate binding domain-containing protein [Demequina sp. NBRC 110053]